MAGLPAPSMLKKSGSSSGIVTGLSRQDAPMRGNGESASSVFKSLGNDAASTTSAGSFASDPSMLSSAMSIKSAMGKGFAGGSALQGRSSSSAVSAHPDFSAAKGSLGNSRLGVGIGRGADTRGLVDAATRGDLPALRKLVEGPNGGLSSSRPDLNARDLQGRTVLMHAVASGSQEIVEFLLAKRADLHATDNVQATAMHYMSKRARNMRSMSLDAVQADILALLLRSRASLEERDRNGCSALLAAVSCGDEAVALGLLKARADVDAKDADGQSSLEVATAFEMGSMVELLRRAPEIQRSAREEQEAADAAAAEEERQAARAERKAAKAAAKEAALAAAQADELAQASEGIGEPVPMASPSGSPSPEPSEPGDAVADERRRAKKEKKAKKLLEAEAGPVGQEEGSREHRRRRRHSGEPPADGEASVHPEADSGEPAPADVQEQEKPRREKKEKKHRRDAADGSGDTPAADAPAAGPSPEEVAAEQRRALTAQIQELVGGSAAAMRELGGVERLLGQLRGALEQAVALGLESAELEEAERCAKELKASSKASEKLRQAVADRSVKQLQKALAKAAETTVPQACIDEAQRVLAEEEPRQMAWEQLQAAQGSGDEGLLRDALAAAKNVGLECPEADSCRQALGAIEQRRQAEETLLRATEIRSVPELEVAIQAASAAGVDDRLVQQARAVLAEEVPRQRARVQLEHACAEGTVDALRDAIRAAQEANLEPHEYSEAETRLKREERKLAALAAIKSALEECQAVDMGSIDDLRSAKERLSALISEAAEAGVAEADLQLVEQRRKKLHNSIEDLKGSIRVFCRVRPLSRKERDNGDEQITTTISMMELGVAKVDGGEERFQFDAVFTPGTQAEVFDDCKDLVQSALDGYNVTIFAYGQTGSGKTYTMYGEPGNEGACLRVIGELFQVMKHGKDRFDYTLEASMVELYRNDLLDLLGSGKTGSSRKKLNIKHDPKSNTVAIENLTAEECATPDDLSKVLDRGFEQRKVAATEMNSESSRSHLIFIIRVLSINKETQERLRGKILLCDLAGSERLKKSGAQDEAQTEAIEINKSLTALGDVISALTQQQKKGAVIPYRNHKLTQLMQDSLGGTAKTLMFVNCSPAGSNLDETHMSLKYATRAKNITNTAVKTKE